MLRERQFPLAFYGGTVSAVDCKFSHWVTCISQRREMKAVFAVACVASVSVRFSARSRHFSFFSRAKIGASAKKCVTGEGKGEKETLARKPHDFEKRPIDTFTVG